MLLERYTRINLKQQYPREITPLRYTQTSYAWSLNTDKYRGDGTKLMLSIPWIRSIVATKLTFSFKKPFVFGYFHTIPDSFCAGIKTRGGSRNFWLGDSNFGSERTVEPFCGKLLLTETSTCFSICERRSPWGGKYCFASRDEQIIGGYEKTITCFNIPGI